MAYVPPDIYIKWVKRSLNRLLGAQLKVDGADHDEYRTAIRSFQAYERITEDAKVGPTTQNHLIRANHQFVNVYADWVRGVLRDTLPSSAVGSGAALNSIDQAGIREFQRSFGPKVGGLKIDGWVGPQTEMVMIKMSGSEPPGDVDSPPHIIFDDDHPVSGDKPKQLTKEEIQEFTFAVIGRRPNNSIFDSSDKVGTFFAVVKAILSLASAYPPFDPWDIDRALSNFDNASFEVDTMKGISYAIMDFATGVRRTPNDLKTNDLYSGVPAKRKGGFELGYRRMHARLVLLKLRTTSSSKDALQTLARMPDKKRALKDIYRALLAVHRNRGALRDSPTVRDTNRVCEFDYSAIRVRCGQVRI